MGYETLLRGSFTITSSLQPAHLAYLETFCKQRHPKRDAALTATLPDPLREAVGLPVGEDGAYFVNGQDEEEQWPRRKGSILNFYGPSLEVPALFCAWQPSQDGTTLVPAKPGWARVEEPVEWLGYLIAHFLQPWSYQLTGQGEWFGDDREDTGRIAIDGNSLTREQYTRQATFGVDFDEDSPIIETAEDLAAWYDSVHTFMGHEIKVHGKQYLTDEGFDAERLADAASDHFALYDAETTTPEGFYTWAEELGASYVAWLAEQQAETTPAVTEDTGAPTAQ